MRFLPTAVAGAFIVERSPIRDDRGSFERTFCEAAFAAAGIVFRAVQSNLSRNPHRGTLRGLHVQAPPHGEDKLVQCVRGRLFDVALDLRSGSPTWGAHAAVELDADGERSFYIPAGCAHGFLTLEPDSDIHYQMGQKFAPGTGIGVRWDDPAFAIQWPGTPALISERDATWPDFTP